MCPDCDGDGIVITEIDIDSGDVLDTEECATCFGTGRIATS